jgi:hypothetical protein
MFLAPDELRLFADGAVLLEGDRTNYQRESVTPQGPSNAVVNGLSYAPASPVDAPDGTTRAARLDFGTSTVELWRDSSFPDPPGPVVSISSYLRAPAGDRQIRSFYTTDPPATSGGPTVDVSGQWEHAELLAATNHGSAGDLRNQAGTALPLDVWGFQMEEAGYPSSLIETTGVAATRAAETLDFARGSLDPLFVEGKWQITFWPTHSRAARNADPTRAATATIFSFEDDQDGANSIDLEFVASSGILRLQQAGIGPYAQLTGVDWSAYSPLVVTVDMSTGFLELSGAVSGNGSTTGSAPPCTQPDTRVRVGRSLTFTTTEMDGVVSDPITVP